MKSQTPNWSRYSSKTVKAPRQKRLRSQIAMEKHDHPQLSNSQAEVIAKQEIKKQEITKEYYVFPDANEPKFHVYNSEKRIIKTFADSSEAENYATKMNELHNYNKTHYDARNETKSKQYGQYNPANVDEAQATEMKLEIDNDGDYYRQRISPTYKNLDRKQKKGTYDKNLAQKQFEKNVVDDWLRNPKNLENMGGKPNKDTRVKVATELREDYEEYYKESVESKQ